MSKTGVNVLENISPFNFHYLKRLKVLSFIFFVCLSFQSHGQSNPSKSDYHIHHLRFNLFLNPDTLFVKGTITSHFQSRKNNLNLLLFDLSDSLNVDEVIIDLIPVPFEHRNDSLFCHIPSKNKGVYDSISITYHGMPHATGFESFRIGNHPLGKCLWTFSEPYGAKDWWPCKQDLTDKTDSLDLYISTPKKYRAAGNGILVSEKIHGDSATYHWKHRYPIATYLIATAVANYAVYSDSVVLHSDTLEILNYVYPDSANLAAAKEKSKALIPVMLLYDKLFGTYPFIKEKYGHAQMGGSGGIEHQTMSFVNNFGFTLLAHELAHQWFGDKVTCASWQDIWLNEGFATFLGSFLVNDFGVNPTKLQEIKSTTLASITSFPDGSVRCTDTSQFSFILDGRLRYDKGAYLLNMLRFMLGDSVFFAACRNYLNDTTLAYKSALTEKLKIHLEKESGKNLNNFFKEWYEGQGFPSYTIKWEEDDQHKIKIYSEQKTSDASVSFFHIPFELQGRKNGKSFTVRWEPVKNQDTLIILNTLGEFIDSLLFDPHLEIIAKAQIFNLDAIKKFDKVTIKSIPTITDGSFYIEFNSPQKNLNRIELIDILGRTLKTIPLDPDLFYSQIPIDLSGLEKSLYFVYIFAKNKEHLLRVIKS